MHGHFDKVVAVFQLQQPGLVNGLETHSHQPVSTGERAQDSVCRLAGRRERGSLLRVGRSRCLSRRSALGVYFILIQR